MSDQATTEVEATGLSIVDILKKRRTYHQAKFNKLNEAILELELRPEFSKLYELIQETRKS